MLSVFSHLTYVTLTLLLKLLCEVPLLLEGPLCLSAVPSNTVPFLFVYFVLFFVCLLFLFVCFWNGWLVVSLCFFVWKGVGEKEWMRVGGEGGLCACVCVRVLID